MVFLMENPSIKGMMTGGTPISGNHQLQYTQFTELFHLSFSQLGACGPALHGSCLAHVCLVGGLEHFSIIYGIILPIDFHIFQRGRVVIAVSRMMSSRSLPELRNLVAWRHVANVD